MTLDKSHDTVRAHSRAWFLAQLKPNSANIAERNLRRQGFQTFLPLEEETRRNNSKFLTAKRPLFPGYIFVSFDPTSSPWRAINATQGITRLVSFGDKPAAVPTEIIAALTTRQAGAALPTEELQPGQPVKITTGPFSDFIAHIDTMAPDRRVWVLLDIMGGATRVAVRSDHLRKV